MVLIKGYRLKEIYNQLLQTGNNWNCSILILVANEVDAICSAKILKTLLENDSLTFQIEPISGYEDVSIIREKYLVQGHTFRSVVLINCGGLIDMRAEWDLPDEFEVFIFDCMRPLNLASVHGCNDIYVVAEKDKYLATDLREAFEIFENGEPIFDSTRAINDDRYREEFEREKRSFEKSEKILENYRIQGNSYSTATALTMLHLAQSLNQVSNNTIWLAILGATYHYQLDHFEEKVYREIVEELKDELNKLKIKTAPGMNDFKAPEGAFAKKLASKRAAPYALPFSSRSNHSFLQNRSASSTPSLGSSQDSSNLSSSQDKSITSNSSSSQQKLSKGSIHFSEELKLPHYRHWTLYESVFHSNYTSTRLGLWSESGRRKLKNLLAKMGVPLTEATQNFSYMKLNLKKNLKNSFKQVAPMYGLPELTYESFIRVFGNEFESPLSAGEAVDSMNALLKMTPSNLNSLLSEQLSAPNVHDPQLPMVNIPTTDHSNIHLLIEVLKKKSGTGSNKIKLNEEDYEDWWKTCFWACYDSISDSTLIRAGIDLSIYFHKLILTQAFSLIQRQEIRVVKEFRLIVIKDGANLPMFHHYHTLSQLGQFLLNALQINSQSSIRSSNSFPLIISSLDESRDIFNVLGLVPNNFYRYQSPLGWVFINSIELTGVRTKMDYFNPSFLQISSEDLVSFIHKLDLKLN